MRAAGGLASGAKAPIFKGLEMSELKLRPPKEKQQKKEEEEEEEEEKKR